MLLIFFRGLAIALAASMFAFASWLFVMSAQASALPSPSSFDSADAGDRQLADKAITDGQKVFDSGSCLNPARQNLVNLLIARMTEENPAKDYKRWSEVTMQLRGWLKSNLTCDPSVSQNWSRLALLDLLQSYDDVSARSNLEASFLLSPILYDDLTQRLAYWSRTETWKNKQRSQLAAADITTLVRYAKPDDVAIWTNWGDEVFKASVKAEVVKLTDSSRRSKIESHFIETPLRGSVNEPTAPAQ